MWQRIFLLTLLALAVAVTVAPWIGGARWSAATRTLIARLNEGAGTPREPSWDGEVTQAEYSFAPGDAPAP